MSEPTQPTPQQDMQSRIQNFNVDLTNAINNGMKSGVHPSIIVNLIAETEFEMRLKLFDQREQLREQAIARAILPATQMPKGPANG